MLQIAHINWLGTLAAASSLPVGQSSTVLGLIFGGLLLYLGLRERYLIIWLGGWVFMLISRATISTASGPGSSSSLMWGELCFVAALTLFSSSALSYTDSRRHMLWVSLLGALGLGVAVAHSTWFPHSIVVNVCFQFIYHAIAMVAALQLLLFAFGRPGLGPWCFAAALLVLRPFPQSVGVQSATTYSFATEILLRVGILLVVLEESRARARRLDVMNAITTASVGARNYGEIMQTAMAELCVLCGAKWAWFQSVEGDDLLLKQQVGLPHWFVTKRDRIPVSDSAIAWMVEIKRTTSVRVRNIVPELRADLEALGLRYLIVVPVVGKLASTGVITFGLKGLRSFSDEQLRFLTTTANQLGLVGENLHAFEQTEADMQRRNRELSALNAMATIATRTFDLDAILKNTLHWTTELFAEHCDILLFDAESECVMKCKTTRTEPECNELQSLVENDLGEYIFRARSEIVTERDLSRLPQAAQLWVAKHGYESFVAVIIFSQRKALGILFVSSQHRNQFNEADHSLAIAIARQLGNSVERVVLYEETARAYDNLRSTQEQLLQSEKMSAVGQLISGVAHELNNPLTAILGYVQLLETEPIGERARDYVGKLYRQTQRTHRVVQNLLSFARQRKPIQSQVDLKRVLEDTLSLRESDLKLNNVGVEREYAPDLPFITGDAHQLEQVFLNIINNAVDAIMDCAQSGSVKIRMYTEASHACVEFRDSGPGLRDQSKIFDPFYTTKKIGKGSGLGLSICYGIVKEHRGNIVAFNHEDGGAVFQVRLPMLSLSRTSEAVPNKRP